MFWSGSLPIEYYLLHPNFLPTQCHVISLSQNQQQTGNKIKKVIKQKQNNTKNAPQNKQASTKTNPHTQNSKPSRKYGIYFVLVNYKLTI